MCKYIILTSGVVPNLGKSLLAVSLSTLLQEHGYQVKYRRISNYLNMNTSLMDPTNEEEAFITVDGAVVDRSISHYERFTGKRITKNDWVSMGSILKKVVEKESSYCFAGAPVHLATQVADELVSFMERKEDEKDADFVIIDIKGTVGDPEVSAQLEAARRLRKELGAARTMLLHLTLVPRLISYYGFEGSRSKPTIQSLENYAKTGLQPDALICKYTGIGTKFDENTTDQIVAASNLTKEAILNVPETLIGYENLLLTRECGLDKKVLNYFGMKTNKNLDLSRWEELVAKLKAPTHKVKIGLVGKYPVATPSAYRNLAETLQHAGVKLDAGIELTVIDSGKTEAGDKEELAKLGTVDGFLIAGGFGSRGMEGLIQAITYARQHKVPILGICLGFQMMAVEFARHDLGMDRAHTTEFDPDTPHPTVHRIAKTLRSGLRPVKIKAGTKLAATYDLLEGEETFFHSWGVNKNLTEAMLENGMVINCYSKEGDADIIVGLELVDHPWFVGVQYHPEMRSNPFNPGKPYVGLIKAALAKAKK